MLSLIHILLDDAGHLVEVTGQKVGFRKFELKNNRMLLNLSLIHISLSVFSVKELPEGELVDTTDKKEIEQDEKYNLVQAAKLLAGNKY